MVACEGGFLYPIVDTGRCTGCNRCTNACPSLSPYNERRPLKAYAAINPAESVRMSSSSGGVFSLLAESVISRGGTVFAARFDMSWRVVHDKTATVQELGHFRGSKYVQSDIGNSYQEIAQLLAEGNPVMFVGTPCQAAGLKHFLGKDHEQLLTVDFICHGVPSPAVWQHYVRHQARKLSRKSWLGRLYYMFGHAAVVSHISFRDKQQGWKNYQTVIRAKGTELRQNYYDNEYMKAFLADQNLRLSCHHCMVKSGRSHSDITLADFWNVHKVTDGFDDDKGTSLVLTNSDKGEQMLAKTCCRRKEVDFDSAIQYNKAWHTPFAESNGRSQFLQEYKNNWL